MLLSNLCAIECLFDASNVCSIEPVFDAGHSVAVLRPGGRSPLRRGGFLL
ncbi:hypothetical protein GoPhGRU1p67 [Gordonia phage GRU1]|uniref:Uncharacterized protein n=1 Tax=Gordonia phage GRU1 TaxID=1109710 RepID=G8EK26_9CAUD|nr:hypothetical protein GoPhGRU1p67 [Gordonia phage GRU1]AET09908.1 hypothetical protein [Gordonia phage GRU1]